MLAGERPEKGGGMITLSHVEEQLKAAGCNFRFWGRAEIKELCNILVHNEKIIACVNGRYEGGFALLCLTDHRLLLIDRKPMFLTLEDLRFDMIAEIDYHARLLDNSVHIITPNRKLVFRSWDQKRLRKVLNETQARVMEIRQHFMAQQLQSARQTRQDRIAAVGSMVVQGAQQQYMQPQNPYAKGPLLLSRRRYPKFY